LEQKDTDFQFTLISHSPIENILVFILLILKSCVSQNPDKKRKAFPGGETGFSKTIMVFKEKSVLMRI
jgi:hypothetical protein